jgi:hypothetical protein
VIVTGPLGKDETKAVVRRDRDMLQVAVAVAGGSVDLRLDNAPALPGSLDDARREVAQLRDSFAPLAAAFPASTSGSRACDDAVLQHLEPDLASHPIRFFDVDALTTPSRSKAGGSLPSLLDAAPTVDPKTSTDEIGDLIRLQPLLPALRAQRVVVGYRVTLLENPRDNGDAVAVTEKGVPAQEGTFVPGRFAAELVVFDRAGARPLCWTTVTATSSDSVSEGAHEHGKLWSDFYGNVAAAIRDGLPAMSKLLRFAPSA